MARIGYTQRRTVRDHQQRVPARSAACPEPLRRRTHAQQLPDSFVWTPRKNDSFRVRMNKFDTTPGSVSVSLTVVGEGDECDVPAVAVRWYDDEPQPGLVEVELTDRHGTVHRLVHKTYFFENDDLLLPDAEYPIDVAVRGTVVAVDGDVLTVRAHHIPHPDPADDMLTFEVDQSDARPVAFFLEGELCEFDAEAIAMLIDDYPGYVLVEFTDAYGRPHQLFGKVPYFGNHDALTPDAKYPVPVTVDVIVGASEDGVTAVSTRWLTSSEALPFVFDMPTTALRITRVEDRV